MSGGTDIAWWPKASAPLRCRARIVITVTAFSAFLEIVDWVSLSCNGRRRGGKVLFLNPAMVSPHREDHRLVLPELTPQRCRCTISIDLHREQCNDSRGVTVGSTHKQLYSCSMLRQMGIYVVTAISWEGAQPRMKSNETEVLVRDAPPIPRRSGTRAYCK